IHGHAHPRIVEAVTEQLTRGSAVSLPTETEVQLAEVLTQRVDSLEKVRFTNSGSEAVMMAVQAARAFTGRRKIIRFDGCYHGSQQRFCYAADLTTLAKIIGGGFPVGAFGGRADVMSVFDPTSNGVRVMHGGTFNANPVTMVAGYTAMEMLTRDAFAHLDAL